MATTISLTALTNDDGTGTTGTVFNNAWQTGLISAINALFSGASFSIAGDFLPDADDGGSLGSASYKWSDVFLASGAVINFSGGDITLSHSADALAIAGGAVSIAGTSAGVLAVGGTIYNHVLAAFGFGGNPLTQTHQVAGYAAIKGNSNAAGGGSFVGGFESAIGTAAGSFTLELLSNFIAASVDKGAGTTITRTINFESTEQTAGTYNAAIANNGATFTDNYFIFYSGTRPSAFGGDLILNATKRLYLGATAGVADNTYIYESATDTITGVAGGSVAFSATAGAFSAPGVYSNTSAQPANVYVYSDGTLYRSTSVRAAKQDIEPITLKEARAILHALRPVTYRGCTHTDDVERFAGFIAEEVAWVAPTLVQRGPDGQPNNVTYDRIPAYMLPLLLDHERRIAAIEGRVQ